MDMVPGVLAAPVIPPDDDAPVFSGLQVMQVVDARGDARVDIMGLRVDKLCFLALAGGVDVDVDRERATADAWAAWVAGVE
jgi:hypothetical protein